MAETPLRLCYTGPAPERARQLEIERRFGLRIVVGYAMSESPYGLIWARGTRPFGTLGSVRQHPRLGTVNYARVARVRDSGAAGGGAVSRHHGTGEQGTGEHGDRRPGDRRPGTGDQETGDQETGDQGLGPG